MTDDDTLEVQPEPLDYSPSSGATDPDHAAQDESTTMKEGRLGYTDNATYIGGYIPSSSDTPHGIIDPPAWMANDEGNSQWDSLNEANSDFIADEDGDSHIETERRAFERRQDCQMWGRQIGLSDPEIQRAIYIIEETDVTMRKYPHGADTAVLAALTLAANEASIGTKKSIRDNGVDTGHDDLVANFESIRADLTISSDELIMSRQDLHEVVADSG